MFKILLDFKEFVIEALSLIKTCLTCFWFWLPVLFAAYFFIQLWMMFFIHPLTIIVLPTILSIYSILQEEERLKLQYGFDEKRHLEVLHPLGSGPQKLRGFRWNVEKAIEEYVRSEAKRRSKELKSK